jgi:hypothetical protein
MSSESQINANRQNAQDSTGPTSEEGKAVSRLNAVKTGLTSRIMLLSDIDAPIYAKYIERFFTQHAPATEAEHDLVQTIADTEWRLRQIAPLVAGVYARGRVKLAHLVVHIQDPVMRDGALVTEIYLTYEKELAAIGLQERRLNGQLEKTTAKLAAMQKDRTTNRMAEVGRAQRALEICKVNNIEPDFKAFGFDFSISEVEEYLLRGRNFFALSGGLIMNFDAFLKEFREEIKSQAA